MGKNMKTAYITLGFRFRVVSRKWLNGNLGFLVGPGLQHRSTPFAIRQQYIWYAEASDQDSETRTHRAWEVGLHNAGLLVSG